MSDPSRPEMAFYGEPGSLYLFDIHYDENDRAHCNPLPDGRVQFRLRTEPGFARVQVVYNDGALRSAMMTLHAADERFLYWEATIAPARPLLRYSFGLRRDDDTICYLGRRGVTHMVETQFELDTSRRQPIETPAWVRGAVIYQIFPDRFARGDEPGAGDDTDTWGSPPHIRSFQGGDLAGVAHNLDHLHDLGVQVIYLNPIFASSSNHRYDTADFYRVDPRLGGDQALRRLVSAVHQQDMRLILDCSFNHCSPRFFAFRDLVERGESSRYRDWFFVHDFPARVRMRPHLIPDAMQGDPMFADFWYQFEGLEARTGVRVEPAHGYGVLMEASYACWYGVVDMPKLNQDNPETRAYFMDVGTYWLREFDIDGWRMDVTQMVPDDFWRQFRGACKAVKPDCYLLAEVWGDSAHWLQGDMFDGTMNYLFRELCVGYFATRAMTTEVFLQGLHRLLARYSSDAVAMSQNLLSSHDAPRFLHLCEGDKARFALALLFQMTMPGAPSIYYGDEVAMTGGNDPDNRRAFPWHDRQSWDTDFAASLRSLIRLRRATPALRQGDWHLLWRGTDAFAFLRRREDQQVLVLINRGPALAEVEIAIPGISSAALLWGECHAAAAQGRLTLRAVPAHTGCCVLLGADR